MIDSFRFLRSQFLITPALPASDFSGQTLIVTGGNNGLGFEAAKHLLKLNAERVIVTVRSHVKGRGAVDAIEADVGLVGRVQYRLLDMSSYASVKSFVEAAASLGRVDGIILNAGIATLDFTVVEDNESTITVNVVSTFLLAVLLSPQLKRTAQQFETLGRLCVVTSDTHSWTTLASERKAATIFEGLNSRELAKMEERYFVSKLLEIYVVRCLANTFDLLPEPGRLSICAVNPGLCHSSLTDGVGGIKELVFGALKVVTARRTDVGARTYVHALSCGFEANGKYLSDGAIHEDQVSPFVGTDAGKKLGEQFWFELCRKLEAIDGRVASILAGERCTKSSLECSART